MSCRPLLIILLLIPPINQILHHIHLPVQMRLRATFKLDVVTRVETLALLEVDDEYLVFRRDEDVAQFDVVVEYALSVNSPEGFDDGFFAFSAHVGVGFGPGDRVAWFHCDGDDASQDGVNADHPGDAYALEGT